LKAGCLLLKPFNSPSGGGKSRGHWKAIDLGFLQPFLPEQVILKGNISGNFKMKARMDALAPMLQKLGLSPERFRVEYVSAAEGVKFAEIVTEMFAQLASIGKDKVKAENAKLRPILENMLKRKESSDWMPGFVETACSLTVRKPG
jgi:hypothetical protein